MLIEIVRMAIERYVSKLSNIEQDIRFAILVSKMRLLEKLSVSQGRIVRAFNVDIDRLKFLIRVNHMKSKKYKKYKC